MIRTGFVGTYTDGDSEGIHHVVVSDDEPAITCTGVTSVDDNPSFLALLPREPVLYAVHEVPAGGASAFRVKPNGDGGPHLSRLGRTESGASGPCHCSVHPSGNFLFVAHYTGGAVSALPIGADGALGSPSDVVEHAGSSEHPERQAEAHPHSITPGPNGRYVYVPDLGTDEVVIYEFVEDEGSLARVSSVNVRSGAGPRHLEFHPDEPLVAVINELGSTLCTYEWNPDTGGLHEIDERSTLPDGYDGDNLTADVHVHPSGDWVYGSNRGHDSIAIFSVGVDGTLQLRQTVPTRGEWPRNFALDPNGEMLFAENKDSDTVVTFHVDDESGGLQPGVATVSIPRPSCLQLCDQHC